MSASLPRWQQENGNRHVAFTANKYVYISTVVILALVLVLQPWSSPRWHMSNISPTTTDNAPYTDDHVIHDLVAKADEHFEDLRHSETYTIANAAKSYRERRGRHPPPGFEAWYNLARQSSTVMVEAFFDQIYEDLEPFWGLEPQNLREFAQQWRTTMTIRNGKPEMRASHSELDEWFATWRDMALHMPDLPDVDLALLAGDQAIVLASFEKVNQAMTNANKRLEEHRALSVNQIKQKISPRPLITDPIPVEWPLEGLINFPEDSDRFWDYIAAACKPTDPIHMSPDLVPKSSLPLVFSEGYTAGTTQGFISNMTTARSVCHNPNLRTLHGFLIRPGMPKFYNELHPIFSFGKIAGIHNDIVIPAPATYSNKMYSGVNMMHPWEEKEDTMVWRGTATGGDWRPDTWFGFQRHRFVSMLNSTVVKDAQADMAILAEEGLPQTYRVLREDMKQKNETFEPEKHHIQLPPPSLFRHPLTNLAEWLDKSVSAEFTHLFCWPFRSLGPPGDCPYMTPYFKVAEYLSASQVLMHKYLPDIDGQSISARFRGFLQSTSTPIKATIFTEWHDSRLTPWRDFIPLSNEFQELYELLYFFIGGSKSNPEQGRHVKRTSWWRTGKIQATQNDPDAIGEKIGQQGSEWARRVLRNEDMVIYFHRVILEFARISSDDRVELGWVDDLLTEDSAVGNPA